MLRVCLFCTYPDVDHQTVCTVQTVYWSGCCICWSCSRCGYVRSKMAQTKITRRKSLQNSLKSSWIILKLLEIIYLKAKINYRCYQMISEAVCQNKNLNLADGFCHGHSSAVVWYTVVYNRHYLAAELRHGFNPKKFPFVFALCNITQSWSAIPSETNTPLAQNS